MHMIAVLFDVVVDMWVDRLAFPFPVTTRLLRSDRKMLAALPLQARAMDHVPEVRNHAHLRPKLSRFVEVNPPRIAAPFGENIENVPRGMVPPDSRIHP